MKKVCFPFKTLFSLLLLTACKNSGPSSGSYSSSPEPAAPTPESATRFEQLDPEKTGIKHVFTITEDYRYNFSMDPNIFNGGGVAVIDVNNDGLQDLFFTARLQGCRLYLNRGNFKFEDISEKAGISQAGGLKTGVSVVDINADGWPDLYVCRTWLEPVPERRNLLFVNNKNSTFSEKAKDFGLDDLSPSQHANFFDFDLDGDLDCYLMNHPVAYKTINNLDFLPQNDLKSARNQPPRDEFESDRLYQNDGKNHFSDITQKAGLLNRAWGLSVLSSDFNDDGWPDLYVGNDFVAPDFLWMNNHNGTFTDQADRAFRHTSNHSMGSDFADLNRDGLADLITVDMLAPDRSRRHRLMNSMQLERDRQMQKLGYGRQVMRNTLQLGIGNWGLVIGEQAPNPQFPISNPQSTIPNFSEIGCLTGADATDWSWAPLLADFDNDGWRDLFISNGIKRDMNDLDFMLYTADSLNRTGGISPTRFPKFEDFSRMMPSTPVSNVLFQNTGSLEMVDVSKKWGFTKNGFSTGAAYADLDNDGDLDLITNCIESPPGIYENHAAGENGQNWLQIKLVGQPENPMGIGAKCRVWAGGEPVFSQEMTPFRGFYSSVEAIFQVGLGKLKMVDKIEIDWPLGTHQILTQISVNQRLVLKIDESKPGFCPKEATVSSPIFSEKTGSFCPDFIHHENEFEDFDRERLLPHRLSQEGPALAVGDLNSDGLDDLFVGGAAGQASAIFIQKKDGGWLKTTQPNLESDSKFEDVAACFFDADGDSDLDLYVVSGGNEQPAGSDFYHDRLYFQEKGGRFEQKTGVLPAESASGSVVRSFDFDKDGDLDLFVGGRSQPGKWPSAGRSFVLKNLSANSAGEAEKFIDATAELAPDFEKIGLVTDLEFADLDGDGQPEMVVAGEWMPISVFKFDGKKWLNRTADFGLENSSGLWNSLTINDLDGDGDMDLATGNLGLNTRLRVWPGAPLLLFDYDFDGNGSADPIVAQAQNGGYRPLVGRDLLAMQMPGFVKKRFPRHAIYAAAMLPEIFPEKQLDEARQLDCHLLATGWWENRSGKFVFHELPKAAQVAPVHEILADDFDGDGLADLLAIGNDYSWETETYRLDASNGCFLKGDGEGHFSSVLNSKSDIWASGEAKTAVGLRLVSGKKGVVVGNVNGRVQVFEGH